MQTKQHVIKASWLIIGILAAGSLTAQSSENTFENPSPKHSAEWKAAPGGNTFMANVSEDSVMKFRVWFANPEKARVTVSVRSETGNYAFSKNIADPWYAQTYDFTGVEDGIYTIEIAKGKEYFRKKILVATDTYTMRRTKLY